MSAVYLMKNKESSPLVKSVLALDEYFSELERIGAKINTLDMRSEFDFDHAQRLLNRFAECGQGMSEEVSNLSTQLNEARARAEAVAQEMANRAAQVSSRKDDQQKKLDEFRLLGEKVSGLNVAMSQLRQPQGTELSAEDRVSLTASLAEFEEQLSPLIDQAGNLRREAQK